MEKSIKYYLNPYVKCIICNDDELLVKHGIRSSFSFILQDEKKTRLLGKLAKHFKYPSSIDDFYSQRHISDVALKEEVSSIVDLLCEKNILIRESEKYIDVYLKILLGEGSSKCSELRFGVISIGSGSLAKKIIENLLAFKPKDVTLCYPGGNVTTTLQDVNTSNLSASINASGEYADCSINIIREKDEREGVKRMFEGSDFVILALEFFSSRLLHLINEIAISERVPWISVLIDGSHAIIGPIYVPGETLCYSEFESQMESSMQYSDDYSLYREHAEKAEFFTPPIIPPLLDITSGYATLFLLRFVLKETSLISKAVFINFEDMSIDTQNLFQLPRCVACMEIKQSYKSSFV